VVHPMMFLLFLFFFSACSSVPPRKVVGSGPSSAILSEPSSRRDIYRVGELEVLVYKDREAMVQDLPELPKLIDGLRFGSKQIKLYGYHDRPNKRIYTVDDIQTLIHEFKHYLEPEWEHPSPLTADSFVGESRDNAVSTMKGSSVSGKPEAVLLPKLSCLPTCLR